ncbi:MAG TPA: PilZ domain-containing protein [Acidimicrobiales bacterium]|nr:PilZ domain-containing protein [Acidimicrobiales bacterium]
MRQAGSGRYHATLAAWDRLVLDVQDGDHAADPEIGELVSIGVPDPAGWVTGEVRVVAQRGVHGLVTTAPELRIAQRRAAHRVSLLLHVDVSEIDDDPPGWVMGETVDVSEDGFAAQVPPIGIVAGDRLGVRLTLPDGQVVSGQANAVAGGPLVRARWTDLPERSRELIAQVISEAEHAAG